MAPRGYPKNARACHRCGSPARGNPCYWAIDRSEATIRSGADSPCSCDRAAEEQYRHDWKMLVTVLWVPGIIVLAIGALYFWG